MGERIPPLLRRRIELLKGTDYEMSEEIYKRATSGQAVFDRVLVWQVPEPWYGGETFEGTNLVKAVSTKTRHEQDTPRGIIVSAGLNALDVLRSQGMDVGHVVHFCVNSLYRRPLDDHDTKHMALLRVGDIVDSEDLAEALDQDACSVEFVDNEHRIVWHGASESLPAPSPKLPWMEG
jgi:hypothetical protein